MFLKKKTFPLHSNDEEKREEGSEVFGPLIDDVENVVKNLNIFNFLLDVVLNIFC
jgi:hypothetical protein